MNRVHWQALAEERIRAAQTLLSAGLWSSAYYVAGYAVEFGLKSCILSHVANTGVIFEEKDFSQKCWTHSIRDLVKLAGIEAEWKADIAANLVLEKNWAIVNQWSEKSRYQNKTQIEAEELYNAINDHPNGVMSWIRSRW